MSFERKNKMKNIERNNERKSIERKNKILVKEWKNNGWKKGVIYEDH